MSHPQQTGFFQTNYLNKTISHRQTHRPMPYRQSLVEILFLCASRLVKLWLNLNIIALYAVFSLLRTVVPILYKLLCQGKMQISLTQDPLMLIFYMVKCDNSVKCVNADFLRGSYVLGLKRCSVVKNVYCLFFSEDS